VCMCVCETITGGIDIDISSVLQRVVVCCSVLHCVALCCSALQRVAVCCNVLWNVAVYCSVLQCVAARRSVLQCVSVCCNIGALQEGDRLTRHTHTHTHTHAHAHTHTHTWTSEYPWGSNLNKWSCTRVAVCCSVSQGIAV